MADDITEGLYFADFDLDKLRDYREHEMLGNTFRKVKVYSELLNDEVKAPVYQMTNYTQLVEINIVNYCKKYYNLTNN